MLVPSSLIWSFYILVMGSHASFFFPLQQQKMQQKRLAGFGQTKRTSPSMKYPLNIKPIYLFIQYIHSNYSLFTNHPSWTVHQRDIKPWLYLPNQNIEQTKALPIVLAGDQVSSPPTSVSSKSKSGKVMFETSVSHGWISHRDNDVNEGGRFVKHYLFAKKE